MDESNFGVVTPRDKQNHALDDGIMDSLQSGYVQRDKDCSPRRGSAGLWQVTMHYDKDKEVLLNQPIDDGCLEFQAARKNSSGDHV